MDVFWYHWINEEDVWPRPSTSFPSIVPLLTCLQKYSFWYRYPVTGVLCGPTGSWLNISHKFSLEVYLARQAIFFFIFFWGHSPFTLSLSEINLGFWEIARNIIPLSHVHSKIWYQNKRHWAKRRGLISFLDIHRVFTSTKIGFLCFASIWESPLPEQIRWS